MLGVGVDIDSLGAGGERVVASVALTVGGEGAGVGGGSEASTGLAGIGTVCIRVVGRASAAPHSMTALMISMLAACMFRNSYYLEVCACAIVRKPGTHHPHLLQDEEIVHRFHCEIASHLNIQAIVGTIV